MLVAADGHLHWYPHYRLRTAFESLVRNLDAIAMENNPENLSALNLGFLVEGMGLDFFDQLKSGGPGRDGFDADIHVSGDGLSLIFMRGGAVRLCLVAGRQIVARERIEILGVGVKDRPDAEMSAIEAVRWVTDKGGIPILPWSPGKWLFKRGALVSEIIEGASTGELAIGDSSLRPRCLPEPRLMRSGREKGLMVVPGSDPLPLPREEKIMGSFGFVYEGPFDAENPVPSVIAMLKGDPARIRPAGERNRLIQTVMRLARLRTAGDALRDGESAS